jgi:hypothetical protein
MSSCAAFRAAVLGPPGLAAADGAGAATGSVARDIADAFMPNLVDCRNTR